MRKFRLALLACVLGAFTLLSPLLVLRATGYRLDIENRRLVATGTIAVTTFPANAELLLKLDDEKTIKKQGAQLSPTVLFPNLLPGTYPFSAQTDQTKAWLKNIEVSEGKTTSFPFVRLFTKEPLVLGELVRAPRGILAHPIQPLLLAWDQRGVFGVRLDTFRELTALRTLLAGSVETAQWLGESDAVVVRMQNGSYAVILNAASAQPSVSPLSRSIEHAIPFGEQTLLVRTSNNSLVRIRLRPELLTEVLAPRAGVLAIATHKDQAMYIDQQGVLWQFSSGNTNPIQRTVSPFETPENIEKLIAAPDPRVALTLTKEGSAWLLEADQDRFRPIAEGVFDAAFSEDSKKLLLKGKHELSFLALADRTDQPIRKKGERETITRLGETIVQAAFLEPEEEYTVFLSNDIVHLTELDGRGGRNTHTYNNALLFTAQPKNGQLLIVSPQGAISALHIPLPGFFERFGPQTPQ